MRTYVPVAAGYLTDVIENDNDTCVHMLAVALHLNGLGKLVYIDCVRVYDSGATASLTVYNFIKVVWVRL